VKQKSEILSVIQNDLIEHVCGKDNSKFLKRDVQIAFKKMKSSYLRSLILKEKKRLDNRKLDEIRPISIETSILPRTHGSSLFTRGETQALAVCTLGGETMAQRYETLFEESSYKFYLQYFFPPFCVGEVGRSGPPGRREIGHGKLAEKSLSMILPSQEEFPYTIRLESNITESFGSSSMASICSGCLSLMDAGVPVKKVVSGIAMGLILENNEFEILSDITGTEDSLGDMDFKISGDDKGITCFQMDIKVEGITKEIMEKALFQAKQGRLHILEKMIKTCSKPKMNLSKYAPRIISMKVPVSKIGIVIGPGGKQIKSIISESGAEVDISDDGTIKILSANEDDALKAQEMIKSITAEVEKGKIYKGKIKSIKSFGLFVEICGKEGLCHISEISHSRIEDLSKIFKEGDMLEVQVLDVNDRGQIKLSHKVLLKKDS